MCDVKSYVFIKIFMFKIAYENKRERQRNACNEGKLILFSIQLTFNQERYA